MEFFQYYWHHFNIKGSYFLLQFNKDRRVGKEKVEEG